MYTGQCTRPCHISRLGSHFLGFRVGTSIEEGALAELDALHHGREYVRDPEFGGTGAPSAAIDDLIRGGKRQT